MAPLNPATVSLIASGVGTLANLGAGYFGAKDARKAQKENERRAAMSNLIRSFGVDHRPEISQPMPGKATQILSGIGKGATAVSRLAGAADAIQDVTTRRAREKLQDKAAQLALDEATGSLAGATVGQPGDLSITFPAWDRRKDYAGSMGPERGRRPTTKDDLLNRIQGMGLSPEATQYAIAAANKSWDDEEVRRLGLDKTRLDMDLAREAQDTQDKIAEARLREAKNKTRPGALTSKQRLEAATDMGKAFAAEGLTYEEYITKPEYQSMLKFSGPGTESAVRSAFRTESRRLLDEVAARDLAQVNTMKDDIRQDPLIKAREDVLRALTEVMQGVFLEGGFADIGALKALAKLQDPGSVVRQEEFTTLKEGLALFDRADIKISNYFVGQQLNEAGRQAVAELALASYEARRADIDNFLDLTIKGNLNLPGLSLTEDLLNMSVKPYRLDTYGNVLSQFMEGDTTPEQLIRERFPGIRIGLPEALVIRNINRNVQTGGSSRFDKSWNTAKNLFGFGTEYDTTKTDTTNETVVEKAKRLKGGG
jgi:hypothetical protein